MAKPSKTRHSAKPQKPVTIDHGPVTKTTPQAEPIGLTAQSPQKPASDTATKPSPSAREKPTQNSSTNQSVKNEDTQKGTSTMASPQSRSQASDQNQTPKASGGGHNGNNGKSRFELIGAGIVGGIIALIIAALLQWIGLLPTATNNSIADNTSDTAAISQLENEIATLKQNLAQDATAQNALRDQLNQAQETLAAFESRFDLLADGASTTQNLATENFSTVIEQVDQLIGRVQTIEQNIARGPQVLEVNQLIAANALKNAIDRGGSFNNELEIYRTIAPDTASIDILTPYAATGLATTAQLSQQFSNLADQMVASDQLIADNANFMQKVWGRIKGLVTSRPIGNVAGDTTGAIVARIEFALQGGDLDRALQLWQQLPVPAQQIGQEFFGDLQARRDSDQLLQQLLMSAMQSSSNNNWR